VIDGAGMPYNHKEGGRVTVWESDSSIVLSGRESLLHDRAGAPDVEYVGRIRVKF
jgi:hypothetical protein